VDEENRRVVADQAALAFLRVEGQSEAELVPARDLGRRSAASLPPSVTRARATHTEAPSSLHTAQMVSARATLRVQTAGSHDRAEFV
jgi:hypothetical protein